MADEWVRMTVIEWGTLGTKLFGPNANDWQVVCPSCGLVQSRQDWRDLGMSGRMVDKMFAFNCIGRWKNPTTCDEVFPTEPSGNGCKYVGTHEPNISPYQVVLADGDERPTFGFHGHKQ